MENLAALSGNRETVLYTTSQPPPLPSLAGLKFAEDALNKTNLSSYIPQPLQPGGGGGGGYPPPQDPYMPPPGAGPSYPGGGSFPSFPAPGQPARSVFDETQVIRFKNQVRRWIK